MTPTERIAWAAGFFYGEGSVSITKINKTSHKTGLPRVSYALCLTVSQKSQEPLDLFVVLFGGTITHSRTDGILIHRWHAAASTALRTLLLLLPYLVVKRQRAELAIDFQNELTDWRDEYRGQVYPDWLLRKREAFFFSMRDLNKRGITLSNPHPKRVGAKAGTVNHFRR